MPTPFEISDNLAKSQQNAFAFFAEQVSKGMAAKSAAISFQANVANQISQSAADYLKIEQEAWRLDQQNQREIEKLQIEKDKMLAYQEAAQDRLEDKERQSRIGERQKATTALGLNLNRQRAPLIAQLGKAQAQREAIAKRMATPSGMAAASFEGTSGLEEIDSQIESLTSKINTIQSQGEALIQMNALFAAGVEPDDDMMREFGITPPNFDNNSEPEQVLQREAKKANANPITPPSDSDYDPTRTLFPTIPSDTEFGQMMEKPVEKSLTFPNEIPDSSEASTPTPIPPTPKQKVEYSVGHLVSSVADIINSDPKKTAEALQHIAITRSYFKKEGLLDEFNEAMRNKGEEVLKQYKTLTMEDVILNVADPLSDGENMPITKYVPSDSVKVLHSAALATEMNPVELDRMKNLLFAKGRSFMANQKKNNENFDFYEDYEGNMAKFQNFVNPPAAKEKETVAEAPVKTRSFDGAYMPAKTIKKNVFYNTQEDVYKIRRENAVRAILDLGPPYTEDHPYVNKARYDGLKGEGLDKLVEKARLEKAGGKRPEDPINPVLEVLGENPTIEKFSKLSNEDRYNLANSIALFNKKKIAKVKKAAQERNVRSPTDMQFIGNISVPSLDHYDEDESIRALDSITPKEGSTPISTLWEFIKKYK